MAGSDRVPDPNDSKRARGWKAQTTTRAKWRSSLSAYRSVLQNVLDTADIVRDGDITSVDHCGTYTIQEPGANAGENPAANLNDLVGSSSNFEDIPAILTSVL